MAILVLGAGFLVGVGLGAGVFGWLAARRLTKRRTPDPPDSPAAHGLPFEAVRFEARDGLRLAGWYITRGEPRATIVLCPGHNGSMDADLRHAPWLWEAGFDALLFDWRAHGASEGRRVSMGVFERRDLLGALDFLRGCGVTRAGLLGFSMGGAVALRVAADDDTGLVKAVVCDGGFAHLSSAIEGYFVADRRLPPGLGRAVGRFVMGVAGVRVGARLSEADPLPHVGRVAPRPVLFIQGASDPYVPLGDQDALYNAARMPKTLWRVHDGGHRDADRLHPEEYRRRVAGFFAEHLGG